MNAKNVLNKILGLLSEDVLEFTDAKTKDGTILQSPTFDLGETVDVVDADGKKTPAPDGEHEIALRDTEGNEVIIRIETKDGKITSRENVEEENPEVEDMEKVKEEVVDKDVDEKKEEDVKMADATTEEAHPLPNTTDEDPRNMITDDSEETEKDPLIALGYRISELEKALDMMKTKMEEMNPPMEETTPSEDEMLPEDGVAMSEEEEELPKLDGAPIESAGFKFSQEIHKPKAGKIPNSQNSFLSKLYN